MTPKFPQVKVKLVGEDGNAFSIIGRVMQELRKAGVSKEERKEFLKQATGGNYDNLLRTVMEWVDVDDDEEE